MAHVLDEIVDALFAHHGVSGEWFILTSMNTVILLFQKLLYGMYHVFMNFLYNEFLYIF